MRDVLISGGQFLPMQTPSKRKEFVGYYPTNPVPTCLDLERSDYPHGERGKVIRRYVLITEQITDKWLFSVEEGSAVFVTDLFRATVEEKGFQGFDWSWEVELS